MSTLSLTYISDNEQSVKKIFNVLMVWFEMDIDRVLLEMNNNPIATSYAEIWRSELSDKVQVVQDFQIGEDVQIGNLRKHNGITYVVIQAHTTQADWTPDVVPALFLVRNAPAPGDDYAVWVQPSGAHDAYSVGDRVTHNGKNWENTSAANVYAPGVWGWVEI